jgi:hypothetical protein
MRLDDTLGVRHFTMLTCVHAMASLDNGYLKGYI